MKVNKKNELIQGDVKLRFTLIDARTLGVKTNVSLVEKSFDDDIVELSYDNEPVLECFSKLKLHFPRNNEFITEYTINGIINTNFYQGESFINQYDYILPEVVPNKIEQYGLPTLGESKGFFACGTYLMGVYVDNYINCLYLKYRYSKGKPFELLEEDLSAHPNFIDKFSFGFFQVIYKFGIPTQFREDVNKILKGEYSKISPAMKRKITSFYDVKEDSYVSQVINRGDLLRKQREEFLAMNIPKEYELESKPVIQLELWNSSLEENGGNT